MSDVETMLDIPPKTELDNEPCLRIIGPHRSGMIISV